MIHSRTVLLVDDNVELRDSTREVLEELGYAVTVAAGGAEALRAVAAAPAATGIDLLVSDVDMPGMSGIELAGRLLARQPDLAVLLISSRGGEPEVRRRLAQGDVAFLAKPFSPEELAQRVGEAVDRVADRPSGAAPATEVSEPMPTASRFRISRALQPVVAVAVVLGLGALLRSLEPGAPPLPAHRIESTTRSATIQVVQPLGPLAAAPAQLIWLPVDGASSYAISLRAIDGKALWQAEVAGPPARLPAEIEASLHPTVTYYWSVEALDAGRRLLGRSELAPFVIELTPGESSEKKISRGESPTPCEIANEDPHHG